MNRAISLLIALLALTGCGPTESQANAKARGEARAAAFVQCMELAAKLTRQGDDDVSDVVDSCATQSAYITNYIKAKGTTP